MFEGPQVVADQMVAEGLLKEEELGALAPPVYFLEGVNQHKVGIEGEWTKIMPIW